VMLSDSKKPACLGSRDLSQNANAVTVSKPKGSPHPKKELSGMSSNGLPPMVILMVRASSMVAPWKKVLVPELS
jgi:hypothetical protein